MREQTPITVVITRFDDLLALGLSAALESDPSITVVARDVEPGRVSVMLRAHRPRVLILDAGALPELAAVRELRVEHPDTRVVVLGDELSSSESAQLLAFGASACLTPATEVRDLRHAIHLASRGLQLQLMPTERGTPDGESALTAREGEVLFLLRQNNSNAQIALALQIGVETVRSHARAIYRKLGVTSRRTLLALSAPASESAPPAAPAQARHHATPPGTTGGSARRRAAAPAVGHRHRHR